MRYQSNLQIFRKRARLTQHELGERLGVARVVVSNWEVGISLPPKEQQGKIAEILGVREKVLFPC